MSKSSDQIIEQSLQTLLDNISDMSQFSRMDLTDIPTPAFIVDPSAVEANLALLGYVSSQSGAKILAALKAFSMWHLAPMYQNYLSGTCASGIHEAQLGKQFYAGEVHVFSAAFSDEEFAQVTEIADHIVFNSLSQWLHFKEKAMQLPHIQFGLRINPEHSEGSVPLYDPCAENSRLGITRSEFDHYLTKDKNLLQGISGFHFHTLCEQGFEPLDRTLSAIEDKFGDLLSTMQWVNFGGGHLITAKSYNITALIERIKLFSSAHNVQVYLEPGEAVAINTGVLVAQVLDKRGKESNQLILNTSATCHMPDTLEMPYRADIITAGIPQEKAFTYRLGGMTCLAGDNIGEYSFDNEKNIGDKLVFLDMSHYTMVKTNTFNGIPLPHIALWNSKTNQFTLVKSFGYEDFKKRLS
jgi:carboxynorspermidine decarboxylase